MAQRIERADIDHMLQRQPRPQFGGDERGARTTAWRASGERSVAARMLWMGVIGQAP